MRIPFVASERIPIMKVKLKTQSVASLQVVLFLWLSSGAFFTQAQSPEKKPVKMKIEAPGKNFRAGEPVEIHVTCLDSENNVAEVKQDYTITMLMHLPSGKVDTAKIEIPAGQAAQKVAMKFQESGIIHLQAQHDRLLQGETFIRVKPQSKAREEAKPKQNNGAMHGESMILAQREQASISAAAPVLTLRYSPQRTLLADGKDQATIQAFVLDSEDSLAQDIRVVLFNNGGTLSQQALIIPAGQDVGSVALTSANVQTITVEYINATPVNPWHGNAIDLDRDGHVLVSFRNSDQIMKINAQTGAIIWRLGGKKNEFTFNNDSFNGFSHQHGIRRLANGNVIFFDNGNLHSPPTSRAVEYRLDEQAKTATLVWEYRHEPALYGFALGFAQRLANGNSLICYGIAQRIIEVDPAGNKVWDLIIEEPNRFVYRAFRIASLY